MPTKESISNEYQAVRRSYKSMSSKSQMAAKENKTNDVDTSVTKAFIGGEQGLVQQMRTVGSCYEIFDLRRIDETLMEVGLSDGIQIHLLDNIKLCGLRKAREQSITNMITTLCTHLSNRDTELCRWVEFADCVAITAAERYSQSLLDNKTMMVTIQECRELFSRMNARLAVIFANTIRLKEDLTNVKCTIVEIMGRLILDFNESMITLKQELSNQVEYVKLGYISHLHEALDDITSKHNDEKARLSSSQHSLECSLTLEREKSASLVDRLNDILNVLGTEKKAQEVLKHGFELDLQCWKNKLVEAEEEIIRKDAILCEEKENKQNEFKDIEARIRLLVSAKDREIEKALSKARAAEEIATNAQKVLSELKKSVIVISSAEDCSEK